MFFVNFLTGLANSFADVGSKACVFIILDEPECPKSLIK